jgi:ABC-2 type transport system ATP-binding protein
MSTNKVLELININKKYKDNCYVVKNINLSVSSGSCFALLGSNGAGKSTILGMISSLINVTNGTIKIYNRDTRHNYAYTRRHIGFMPQEVNLNIFETPIQILVSQAGFFGIPRKKAVQNAFILLKEMMLYDKRDSQVRFLSGGMKRRLMVARALIHKPKILILDEPTAGVDVEIRQSLWSFIRKLNKQEGVSIILTTHYLEEAEHICDHLAFIHNGSIRINDNMYKVLQSLNKTIYTCDLNKPINKYIGYSFCNIRIINRYTLEIIVEKGITLNYIFLQLSRDGIEVQSIRIKSNKLEQLFNEFI